MKNTLLFTYSTDTLVRLLTVNIRTFWPKNPKMCDPILVTLLKMQPHYSQSSLENVNPSSGASPLAFYKEVPSPQPPPPPPLRVYLPKWPIKSQGKWPTNDWQVSTSGVDYKENGILLFEIDCVTISLTQYLTELFKYAISFHWSSYFAVMW